MRKLIKKYQYGSEFAVDKGLNYPNTTNNYPNTTNVGAIDWSGASAFQKNKIASIGSTEEKPIPQSLGDLSDLKNGGGGFFNKIGGLKGISNAAGVLSSLMPKPKNSATTQSINSMMEAAENIPGPVGMFAKIGNMAGNLMNAIGFGTDQVTTTDQIMDSHLLKTTPIGILNSAFTTKLASLKKDQDTQETLAMSDGGYGGFRNAWDEASKYSGKKVGLFSGKNKYNNMIYDANRQMALLSNITNKKKTDDLLTAQMEDRWNQATMNLMNGGLGNVSFGRLGLKIEILPKVHELLNKPKVMDILTEWEEETPVFKEGGKMNVIPEGSLHARLHHMENAEGLTKKGIPVVSIAEGGELEQQAEIELNEIIFNLEVTTELEKLMQDGSDNAAIEAGKLLVKEIFENTDDRTGLIKQLEPEKKEPTVEDIVKNHQVFQDGGNIKPSFEEWFKTIPEDRNNFENYNLKRAYELAPWEELERWRTATPEQLNNDKYHLKTFYWNDKGEGEFVKKSGHPTLIKELEAYFTNKDFREKYDLDMSGDYFKYIKRND